MKQDILKITILEDGTIKTETDKVSMANHTNAEGFLRCMAGLAGGAFRQVRKIGASLHSALHQHASDGHTHDHANHSH